MKGVVLLMLSQIIIKIVGLIYKLYLTNKQGFGDIGNAIYGSAFQIYSVMLTISSIGVPNAIAKLVAGKVAIGDNKGAYRVFKIAIAIFGVLGFAGSSIMFFGAKQIANIYLQIPEAELSIIALSPSVFLVSIGSVLKGYFNGRENLSVTANSQSLEQIFKTVFTIFLVENIASLSGNNTVLMAATATMGTTISTLFSGIYLYKYFAQRKKEVWKDVILSKKYKNDSAFKITKNILLVAVPIALCGLFSVMGKTIDALTIVRILKKTIGEEAATLQYGILSGKVDTLINLPFSLNIALATALVPTISATMAKKQIEFAKKRIEFSILITILISLPFVVYLFVYAKQILYLLFPNATSGAYLLRASSLSIIFVVIIQTVNSSLQGIGKLNIPVIAFAIGALIKLVFNIILLNVLGILGAVISSILSHITALTICFITLKKNMKLKLKFKKLFIKPIIASLAMGMISYLTYIILNRTLEWKIAFMIALIIGLILYVICIFLINIFNKEEIYMIPYGKKLYEKFKNSIE